MARKDYDDDGRTIASMENVTGTVNWLGGITLPGRSRKKTAPEEPEKQREVPVFTARERGAIAAEAVRQAILAALVGGAFLFAVFGLAWLLLIRS